MVRLQRCVVPAALMLLMGLTCDQGNNQNASDETRTSTVSAIKDLVAVLVTANSDKDAAAIQARLGDEPGVESADTHAGSVVARFSDGEALVVFDNRVSDAGGGAAPKLKRPDPTNRRKQSHGDTAKTRVPAKNQAVVINAMGDFYTDSGPVVQPWLEAGGYEVETVTGTVEDYRQMIAGQGCIYISAHGAAIPAGVLEQLDSLSNEGDADTTTPASVADVWPQEATDHFVLWTSTPATLENIHLYRDELRSGLLCYGIGATDKGDSAIGATFDAHICVTEAFIRKYWTVAAGGVIYIDSSHSANKRLRDVCLGSAVGAAKFMGWSNTIFDRFSKGSTQFFFDRALGANEFPPIQSPRQRPFSLSPVFDAMHRVTRPGEDFGMDTSYAPKGLTYTPGGSHADQTLAVMLLFPPAGDVSTLRPTIQNMNVNEAHDDLVLGGTFGDDEGTVSVGGHSVTVTSWTESEIHATIPREGNGSSGDVIVTAQNLASVPRRLSAWDMVFRFHYRDEPLGSVFYDVTWNARIRGDLAQSRTLPDTDPDNALVDGTTTGDATVDYGVGGSYVQDAVTNTWQQNGDPALTLVDEAVDADSNVFSFSYQFARNAQAAALTVRPAINVPNVIETCSDENGCGAPFVSVQHTQPLGEIPAFQWDADQPFTVVSDEIQLDQDSGSSIDWDSSDVQDAPDPDQPI